MEASGWATVPRRTLLWPNGEHRQARGGSTAAKTRWGRVALAMWPAGERRIGLVEEVQGGRGKRGYKAGFLVNMCAYIVAK